MCTKHYDQIPEIWCGTDGHADGQTDGQKKWHIEVDAPPKKPFTNNIQYSNFITDPGAWATINTSITKLKTNYAWKQ